MKTLFYLFLSLFVANLQAQEYSENRQKYSLDEGWRFHEGDIPFPVIKGHSASYQNAKAGRSWGAAAPKYDDSQWKEVNLPHDWAVEQPFNPQANLSQGFRDRGFGWYRRTFEISPEDKGKHFELQFDGIATYATIWVNGTLLHRNWCGYTSSYIDITPYVTYGQDINTIAVRVDAQAQEGWWYEGAGIYRHTWLVKRSPLHIKTDGVHANPVKHTETAWTIPVEVELYNADKETEKVTVSSTLYGPNGQKIVSGNTQVTIKPLRESTAQFSLAVQNPELWDIEQPKLYTVTTEVMQNGSVTDRVTTRCGFRSFHFDANTGFYLNGNPVKIKGVCNHQDHAGVGVALPDALWEFRIRKLKEMGANAYRCAHNPPSKELLEVCDSLGMLVMDENRVFNTSPEYRRQLEWLVRRDRNHPCVFLWSVFNEEPMQGTENGYEMVRRMRDIVEQLDTTRPVTAAMNGGLFTPVNVSNAVDIVGFNYQHKSYDRFHQKNPKMKLLSSEDTSAFQVRGEYKTDKSANIIDSYDSESAKWGLTHRKAWKAIDERPYLAGCFIWTGFDYRGEPTPFAWPSAGSFFGIMDLCGFPKMAYYLHQAQWSKERPVMHVIPHWNWPTDSIGKPLKVMTLTNADSVKVLLNGKKVYTAPVDKYEMNTFHVPYQPGRLEAIGYKAGKVYARHQIETTGTPQHIRLTPYRAVLQGNGMDATPITVEVTDKKGRHIPTANLPVEFELSGPGKIIGLGNGNPNSHEPEKGNKRSLFNGYAQVIIQADPGASEPIMLTASIKGMKYTTLQINTLPSAGVPSIPAKRPAILLSKWYVSPCYKERPNPNEKVEENDMNSWELLTVGSHTLTSATGYYLYRTSLTPYNIHQSKGGVIRFKQVHGKAEVWLGNRKLAVKETSGSGDLEVKFPPLQQMEEIRILFEASSAAPAGLSSAAIVE